MDLDILKCALKFRGIYESHCRPSKSNIPTSTWPFGPPGRVLADWWYTVHHKEPLESFEIRAGHSSGFGLPSVAKLPIIWCWKRRKAIFTHSLGFTESDQSALDQLSVTLTFIQGQPHWGVKVWDPLDRAGLPYTVNMMYSADLMLGHRLQRWPIMQTP